ncbi:MAG: hypothetical protein ACLFS4_06510, partial [Opitutales bacterium]
GYGLVHSDDSGFRKKPVARNVAVREFPGAPESRDKPARYEDTPPQLSRDKPARYEDTSPQLSRDKPARYKDTPPQ